MQLSHLSLPLLQVAKLDSTFLMQVHKENLIRDACNYLTYLNRGDVEEECVKMLANPGLSTAKLKSMDFRKDMCNCPTCTNYDEIVPIPAKLNGNGGILFYSICKFFLWKFPPGNRMIV